jgi:hypothetical protein
VDHHVAAAAMLGFLMLPPPFPTNPHFLIGKLYEHMKAEDYLIAIWGYANT